MFLSFVSSPGGTKDAEQMGTCSSYRDEWVSAGDLLCGFLRYRGENLGRDVLKERLEQATWRQGIHSPYYNCENIGKEGIPVIHILFLGKVIIYLHHTGVISSNLFLQISNGGRVPSWWDTWNTAYAGSCVRFGGDFSNASWNFQSDP